MKMKIKRRDSAWLPYEVHAGGVSVVVNGMPNPAIVYWRDSTTRWYVSLWDYGSWRRYYGHGERVENSFMDYLDHVGIPRAYRPLVLRLFSWKKSLCIPENPTNAGE